MAGAGRCLSDLSDDLLRHILFLAPDREGASTAVLSRRWRWLWRTSGIVYLDSRSFIGGCSSPDQARDAFHRGAEDALSAAALSPIRRLTFSISQDSDIWLPKQSWSRSEQKLITEHHLMEVLVSNPAARGVEELQIDVKASNTGFTLSFCSLPSEALRVLRIIGCKPLTAAAPPPAAATFPMLVDLHLQDCNVSLVDLQSIVDASPRLSTLHLASCDLFTADETNQLVVLPILIPAVSALVLTNCKYQHEVSLELDAPRLQHFRYRGSAEVITDHLSIKSQVSAANMVHVDLDLTHPTPPRETFWRFIQNFNTAKLLKLRMDYITMNELALIDRERRDELLGGLSFSLLEQLELEAEYWPGFPGMTSMMMLANLLQCCLMVRDIRIKLTNRYQCPWGKSSIDKEAGLHFDKSVSGFMNRRRTSLAGQNYYSYQAFDVPGLTGEHSFRCLQSHLKRVSLQFFMDDPNCLGVRLAMFFVKNATVLREIHIDDGCQEMTEHVNFSVRRWIANTVNANNQLTVKD